MLVLSAPAPEREHTQALQVVSNSKLPPNSQRKNGMRTAAVCSQPQAAPSLYTQLTPPCTTRHIWQGASPTPSWS